MGERLTRHQQRLEAQGDTRAKFKKDLKDSEPYVELTRQLFSAKGFHLYEYPKVPRGDGSEKDQHDLGVVEPYEVKHREFNFASLADLTAGDAAHHFGLYAATIVDTYHQIIENLALRNSWPNAFYIWSLDAGFVLVIDVGATWDAWKLAWLWDREKRRYRLFFLCPLFMDEESRPIYRKADLFDFTSRMGGSYPRPFRGVRLFSRLDLKTDRDVRLAQMEYIRKKLEGAEYYDQRADELKEYVEKPTY